jgi:general secretion pathway protein G
MMLKRLLKTWMERRRERQRVLGRRDRAAGFTMLEIMIVIAIIAAIGAGVGVAVFSQFKKAQVKIAKQRVKEVMQGVTTFMIDNNNCPRGMDQLVAEKYLAKGAAKDPWGKDFTLKCPGTNDPEAADVSSAGPDKQDGTPDDIRSWEM